jgi:hypothetical protein
MFLVRSFANSLFLRLIHIALLLRSSFLSYVFFFLLMRKEEVAGKVAKEHYQISMVKKEEKKLQYLIEKIKNSN